MVSPCILMNNFMSAYKESNDMEKVILNISSGAAVNAYDGWAGYCTSKAGINMFSEVINAENNIKGYENFKVLSVAPGVLETAMQGQIRESSKKDFSQVDRFLELKNDGALKSPKSTAIELLSLIEKSNSKLVYQDLRNS